MAADSALSTVVAAGSLDCKFENAANPCGFPAPDTGIFFFDDLASVEILGMTFGFNKVTILVILGVVIVLAFFLWAFRRPKVVPRGSQNVGEMGYLFVRDGIAREVIGKDGDKFVPFLFSFFFLVWILNFMGVMPFVNFPATSVFAIPVAFALIVYLTWLPLGIYRQGFVGFFKGMLFPPGVPKPMLILLARSSSCLTSSCGHLRTRFDSSPTCSPATYSSPRLASRRSTCSRSPSSECSDLLRRWPSR